MLPTLVMGLTVLPIRDSLIAVPVGVVTYVVVALATNLLPRALVHNVVRELPREPSGPAPGPRREATRLIGRSPRPYGRIGCAYRQFVNEAVADSFPGPIA